MKKQGGHFKQKSEPTVVNAKQGDETDVSDLLESIHARAGETELNDGSDVEEDDEEEGMNVDDKAFEEQVAEDNASGDEEETKQ